MEIQVQRSETFKDAQVVTSNHPAERNVLHLTWDELESLVAQGQRLIEQRDAIRSTRIVLSDRDRAEMAQDEQDWHEECGHYHLQDGAECPETPCGDYRCCIN